MGKKLSEIKTATVRPPLMGVKLDAIRREMIKHLIIGAGISGCSIAYNLAAKGESGILVLDKSYLTRARRDAAARA